MYAVTGRDAQIAGQSQFANPTTTWLEARSVRRNRKLKIKPLDAWEFRICKHNANGKAATLIILSFRMIKARGCKQRFKSDLII